MKNARLYCIPLPVHPRGISLWCHRTNHGGKLVVVSSSSLPLASIQFLSRIGVKWVNIPTVDCCLLFSRSSRAPAFGGRAIMHKGTMKVRVLPYSVRVNNLFLIFLILSLCVLGVIVFIDKSSKDYDEDYEVRILFCYRYLVYMYNLNFYDLFC